MPETKIKTTEQANKAYEKEYLAISDELNRIALASVQLIEDRLTQSGLSGKHSAVWNLVDLHRTCWKFKNFVKEI